jgi:hypothetical protein
LEYFQMKKTLIALAVLAASGASFAQATVTGNVSMGYLQSTMGSAAGGVDASGFGVDTAELYFDAVENLGGGSKVSAKLGFDTVSRGGVIGGDTLLVYSNAQMGTLTLGSTRGADYLTGGIAAVGNKGLDGAITSARASNDFVSYSFPITPAFKLGFSHTEGAKTGATPSTTPASNMLGLGLGAGAAGTDIGEQRRNMVYVDYAAGALVANVGYGSYDQQGNTATNFKTITRGAVSYDLGMAKLGAGFDNRVYVTGNRMDYAVGVMVPVGSALSVGALFAQRTYNDTNDVTKDGTRTGYSLRANYALSKMTSVVFDYQNYKKAFADTANSSTTELYLSKSF